MAWTTTFLVVSILVLLVVAYTAGQTWNLRLRRQRKLLRDRMATTGPEPPADRPPDAGGHQGSITRPDPAE